MELIKFEINLRKCFYLIYREDGISAQPHIIGKQSRSPKGNLLFSPLFSLSKNCMDIESWVGRKSYYRG